MDILNEKNYEFYAIKNYDSPGLITIDEFQADTKKFKYIKRLLNKYQQTGVINPTTLINHIIILYNVFSQEAATRLLFFKLKGYYPELVSILSHIQRLPETVSGVEQIDINTSKISPDMKLFNILEGRVDGRHI